MDKEREALARMFASLSRYSYRLAQRLDHGEFIGVGGDAAFHRARGASAARYARALRRPPVEGITKAPW